MKGNKNPYFPQLTPEREILASKESLLAVMRGTDCSVRWGEQYMMSSRDGAVLVTSSEREASQFRHDHHL